MRLPTLYITILTLAVLVLSGSMLINIGPADMMHEPWSDHDGGTQAPGIDTDGDGLKDVDEDLDLDGMIDGSELYPTHPYNRDTDGDGIDDGTELELLTNRSLGIGGTPSWLDRLLTGTKADLRLFLMMDPLSDLDGDSIANILDPDMDGDGIIDGVEIGHSTDPLDPDSDDDMVPDRNDTVSGAVRDTDSDGLDDDWEVFYKATDPDADPDGDLIPNLVEFQRGSDPLHLDTSWGGRLPPSAYDVRDIEYPDRVSFVLNDVSPIYVPLSVFSILQGATWKQLADPDDSRTMAAGSKNVTIDLNGYWVTTLPTPPRTSDASALSVHPAFPDSHARHPYYLCGVLRSIVPVGSYAVSLSDRSAFDPILVNRTEDVARYYTDIPSDIDVAVLDAAEALSKDMGDLTPGERALSILSYIHSICVYSDEGSMAEEQRDPLSRFLFLTRRGDSLDFATAFTILSRIEGIPSRLVIGYALGQLEGDHRVFRNGHIHAWSEIAIEGIGWVPVETTPRSLAPEFDFRPDVDGVDPDFLNRGDGGAPFHPAMRPSDPSGDPDGDGLTNEEEGELGTDPMLPDTDGDGLWDRDEVAIHSTDPLVRDTDMDGLLDGEEVNVYGTNATSPDTDRGGVWDRKEVLLGLDPNDPLDDRRITDSDMDGLADSLEPFLGTSPLTPDLDRDGLLDGWEYHSYNTNMNSSDTDSDSLTDLEEVFGPVFTDPLRADTDGDGVPDQVEISRATDPRTKDTDRDGSDDGVEAEEGTDPLDPDTDGDGLRDGAEASELLDPLVFDTDGDGAGDGWETWSGSDPMIPEKGPRPPDADGDGLQDIVEMVIGTGVRDPDSDDDGLPDGLEAMSLSTDPLDNDTDGDGIDDMNETMFLHTNPLSNDTDGDQLTDHYENVTGTNPLYPDTDRDGIPDATELGSGTDPLSPDSDSGGLSDSRETMLGRDPLDPLDDFPVPDRDGDGLDDASEDRLGCDPDDPDSDDDGLGDGLESLLLRSDPLSQNSDGDELSDGVEFGIGTDPNNDDTDGDLLSDSWEVDSGTDPLKNDTDGDGLDDGSEAMTYRTDPLMPDTDMDGLTDRAEVLSIGTNATMEDTDGGMVGDGIEYENGNDPLDPSDDGRLRDSDSDGLTDLEEGALGTDPNDQDTDGDGAVDSYEVRGTLGWTTDPLDPDSDEDNITDGEEMTEGNDTYVTNPLSNDTDGDTIIDPDEIIGTMRVPSDPSSADGDEDGLYDLTELGGSTDPLNRDSDSDGLPDGWIDGWVGLPLNGNRDIGEYEDRDLDGTVDEGIWGEGSGPGETDPMIPDTDGGGAPDGYELLNVTKPFDPLDPIDDQFILDSDRDGLRDTIENDTAPDGTMTDWNDPDTDGDTLLDGAEDVNGNGRQDPGETDPTDPDSDDDMVRDDEEIAIGTDPTDPDTDGDGLMDGPTTSLGEGESTGYGPWGPTDPLEKDTDGDGLWDGYKTDPYLGERGPQGDEDYPATDPNDPDTDHDYLSDYYEVVTTNYLDSKVNWTGDPLYDDWTDPLDPDTDGGAAPDGYEVNLKLNPLDPSDDSLYWDADGDGLSTYDELYTHNYEISEVDWDGDGRVDHNPDPEDNDTDGDGMDDGSEVIIYRTNPLLRDTDRDQLSDRDEIWTYNTNPLEWDTDGDGLSDPMELTSIYIGSSIDWTGDGIADNWTDPLNRDTDLDSIDDGDEVIKGTNPLDWGDPGVGTFPTQETRVLLDKAPNALNKYVKGSLTGFKVHGALTDPYGAGIGNISITVLIVPKDTDSESASTMARNPTVVVGSGLTDRSGEYSIRCTFRPQTPYGDCVIYALSSQTRHQGVLFLADVSAPLRVSVTSASMIDAGNLERSMVLGSPFTLSGRLQELGGDPIGGGTLSVELPSGVVGVTTRDDGSFSLHGTAPDREGVYEVVLEFGGERYLSGCSISVQLTTVSGSFVVLTVEPDPVRIGDGMYINGSFIGLVPSTGGYNITIIDESTGSPVASAEGPITGDGISWMLDVLRDRFQKGPHHAFIVLRLEDGSSAEGGAVDFQVIDPSMISIRYGDVVRGEENHVLLMLRSIGGRNLPGASLSVMLEDSPWFARSTVMTNETGVATVTITPPPLEDLGEVKMTVSLLSGEGEVVDQYKPLRLMIVSRTYLLISERPDILVLGSPFTISGRLSDDAGSGLEEAEGMELQINDEIVSAADLTADGAFRFTYTVPVTEEAGPTLLVVRFSDLTGDQSGFYLPAENRTMVRIYSRTALSGLITTEGDGLIIGLTDGAGNALAGKPLTIGSSVNFTTLYTSSTGNLTLNLSSFLERGSLSIIFQGDDRYLRSELNVTLPEEEDGSGSPPWTLIAGIVLFVTVTVIAIAGVLWAVAVRRRVLGQKMLYHARTDRYGFSPRTPVQFEVVESYRRASKDLSQKGAPRPDGATPVEYREMLRDSLAAPAKESFSTLTDMFMEARFSDHDMDPGSVPKAHSLSKKVSEGLPQEGTVKLSPPQAPTDDKARIRWRMRMDHDSDLKSLLGDKGGGA
jgi:hypothetical protein